MNKSQTATEYLIILAVVIVIALIVVGVIGGIPAIGGGASERNTQTYLRAQEVGIDSYSVTANSVKLEVKNNRPETVEISTIMIYNGTGWKTCDNTTDVPATLLVGETKVVTCNSLVVDSTLDVGERYSYPVNITYIEKTNNVQYVVGGNNYKIEGKIGTAIVTTGT